MSSERRPSYGRPGQQLSRREVRELEEAARLTKTQPVGRSHPVPAQPQPGSRASHLEDTQRDLPAQQGRPSHMESTQQIPAQPNPAVQSAIPAAQPRPARQAGRKEPPRQLPAGTGQAPQGAQPSRPMTTADQFAAQKAASQPASSRRGPTTLRDALAMMVAAEGSDLHVTAGLPPMMRQHGSLQPIPGFPVWDQEMVEREVLSLLRDEQLEKFKQEGELDIAYELSPQARFRMNVYRQRGAVGTVMRHVTTNIRNLDDLNMPPAVGEFSKLSKGLVLVTGPTGSGKSTTLAALIDKINRTRAEHIMTVEDPIEYLHPHKKSIVNQRQVGDDTESFQRALRQVLRQDPDVILIGEMRDLETIQVALTAAETGHLVFGTLHTQSAPQTIDRIIDVFPPHQQNQIRAQLASTLKGVVCQTLVPRVGGGRVAATEILVMTTAVANLVREGQMHQLPGVLQSGAAHGMHTYDQHFIKLVEAGEITVRDAEEKVTDKESFRQRVQSVFRGRREDAGMGMPGVEQGYGQYKGWNGQG
ncbi:type IV pilus twitching motility protein PilT [Nesterenkonia populi]|uniref:type IV pilus twitching motility protein PilT n=1 Tax=Nesterenkonia populi TaxID=1591087 RepID=UPI001FE68198|nr:type IV pilus twitching motility protein PilT [Nesterenkonia populi]